MSQSASRPAPLGRNALILLVSAGIILSLCMGLRQSLGLFLRPMNVDIGVSASAFGFAMALQNIVWGISQPFVGVLADRYGARPVVFVSAGIYVAGLAIMALGGTWGLDIGGGILIGIGVAGSGFGVLLGAVSQAVPPARRSQTVGLVSGVGSLATLVLAPLGQALIDGYGWQNALLAFAAISALMALFAFGMGRHAPRTAAQAAADMVRPVGEALSAAGRHRGFIAMAIAFFACGFQLIFIVIHLPTYLALCGIPPAASATALGLIGLGNAVGSYVIGILGARFSQKKLLALIYLLRTITIGLYLALPISIPSTMIFAATMGFLWLSVTPLVSGLIGRLFGLGNFNLLYGVMFFSHQIGSFVGAWAGGLVYDLTGVYDIAWASMIAIGLSAFALQWFMDDSRAGDMPGLSPAPAR